MTAQVHAQDPVARRRQRGKRRQKRKVDAHGVRQPYARALTLDDVVQDHGIRMELPAVRRASMSLCARAASASG